MADLTYAVEVALGGTLTDVTDKVTGFTAGGGRRDSFDGFTAGACTFTIDDRTGDFVPGGGGTWSGESWIGREVRISVTAGGLSQVIWRGHVDDVDVQVEGFFFAAVPVKASDPLALLARTEIDAGTAFSSETSDVRIENVLALAEVDTGYFVADTKNIEDGDTTLQAESDASGNTLQYLQLVEQSEGGRLYITHGDDVGGVLNFQPRSATSGDNGLTFQDEDGGSASLVDGGTAATTSFDHTWDGGDATNVGAGTYSDTYSDTYDTYGGPEGGDAATRFRIPHEGVEFGFTSVSQLVNRVTYQREGGTAQTVEDTFSQDEYGFIRTVSKSGLLNATDADVEDLAEARLARQSTPRRDVRGLSVLLDTLDDDQAAMVLRSTVGDRVRVVTNPPGYVSNGSLTSNVRIEQVTHMASTGPSGSHTVEFRLTALSDEFAGLVDGGDATTSSFDDTWDGGTAATFGFARVLTGGDAAFV